jgi:hypothetical protein
MESRLVINRRKRKARDSLTPGFCMDFRGAVATRFAGARLQKPHRGFCGRLSGLKMPHWDGMLVNTEGVVMIATEAATTATRCAP